VQFSFSINLRKQVTNNTQGSDFSFQNKWRLPELAGGCKFRLYFEEFPRARTPEISIGTNFQGFQATVYHAYPFNDHVGFYLSSPASL